MKSLISLIAVLACAPALGASDFENMRRTAAFELSGIAAQSLAPVPGPAAPKRSGFIYKGSFCWQRGKDSNAERMGMPVSFRINSMEITAGIHENPKLNLQGAVLSGLFDIKIGPPGDGLYKAVAVIFRREPLIQVCAPAEGAYIELSMLIDERGKIVSDPGIKSFYGRTSDTCGSPWDYHEIKYTFTAL